MIINKTYEIPSCDDVELGLKRDSLLEFISYATMMKSRLEP